MIDTALIRSKVLEQAVMGELSVEFDSNVDSLIELGEASNRNVVETKKEVPYELKEGWHWFALSELGSDDKHSFADGPFGSNLKKEHYTENAEVRIIQLSNVGELGWKNENVRYTTFEHLVTIQRSEVKAGNIVIAKMMPAGRAIIVPDIDEKYVLSSDCVKFVPCEFLNTEYLCYAINSGMFRKQVLQDVHGIGRERTSLSKLKTYLLPIPCRAEQDYIVEKINKAYEQLASLDIFQTQYSSDLEVLKLKIIDAGIRGKLTEQLSEDGTAEELLEQIAKEKKQLIKEKKTKATKALPEITEDEIPFEIPVNWKWVRLADICSKITSGNTPAGGSKGGAYVTEGNCFFREQNIYNDGIHYEGMVYITDELLATRENSTVLPQDILLNITGGSIGRCALIPDDFSKGSINQHILIIRVIEPEIRQYIHKCLCSPYYQKLIMGNVVGDKDGFSAGRCKNTLIPLPPIGEQKRIVEKITQILEQI